MDRLRLYIIGLIFVCIGCGKNSTTSTPPTTITWDGNVIGYVPVPVAKSSDKKVFVHYMPWFETKITNNGFWGQHWKMNTQNPEIITDGKRQIASHYYPLNTGPYATSDTNVIDYHLLLMKLSGIDGIFIDWPGTINFSDYQKNVTNSNAVISRLAKAGLKYAILYEDQNLVNTPPSNQMAAAQADMRYIQANYFKDAGTIYETYNGKPMLLDFGPFGPFKNASDWNTIFSVMSTPPAFFPYEYSSGKGGTNVAGEFAWVQQNHITNLNNFYSYNYGGEKISGAYPGFNNFYAQGGWPNNANFTIPYSSAGTTTFDQTLSLALQQTNNDYIQLITWNDYGEGTMIEPTTEFGYSFLTTLQQKLGVQSLSQTDLELVAKLYTSRVNNTLPYNRTKLNELDQIYYYMASLKMDSAKALLQQDF